MKNTIVVEYRNFGNYKDFSTRLVAADYNGKHYQSKSIRVENGVLKTDQFHYLKEYEFASQNFNVRINSSLLYVDIGKARLLGFIDSSNKSLVYFYQNSNDIVKSPYDALIKFLEENTK